MGKSRKQCIHIWCDASVTFQSTNLPSPSTTPTPHISTHLSRKFIGVRGRLPNCVRIGGCCGRDGYGRCAINVGDLGGCHLELSCEQKKAVTILRVEGLWCRMLPIPLICLFSSNGSHQMPRFKCDRMQDSSCSWALNLGKDGGRGERMWHKIITDHASRTRKQVSEETLCNQLCLAFMICDILTRQEV